MRGPQENGKLSLEQYADFFDNLQRSNFTVDLLNKIVCIHGFSKHRRKKDILDSLAALELMPPTRSTLQENISYCASLTVEEVKQDLESIGWQECPIGSVHSTFPTAGDGALAVSSVTDLCCSATGAAPEKKRQKPRVKKRKHESTGPTAVDGAQYASSSVTDLCCSVTGVAPEKKSRSLKVKKRRSTHPRAPRPWMAPSLPLPSPILLLGYRCRP